MYQFFAVETIQKGPLLVMYVGHIALFFDRFRFSQPHAPQARPQKTSEICILFVQVASLGDFCYVSAVILTPL